MTATVSHADRIGILARALVTASAELVDDPAARVALAGCAIPTVIGQQAEAMGIRFPVKSGSGEPEPTATIADDRLAFAKVAVAVGFCRQSLPGILSPQKQMARFGAEVRDAFDLLIGLDPAKAPTVPADDGDIVWALFFDEQGCGPTAVSLTPTVIDFRRLPGEPDPGPDDILSRNIMLGVDISPSEHGWPEFTEPGGYAMKVPAAERLIAKLREAIDRPRDPRLDAPRAEVG